MEKELSTEASAIRKEMSTLQTQYDTALANAKSSLEEQMATMQANLNAADRETLNKLSALESGRKKLLPVSSPLRTVRASFPAYGSSF